jgi:uncharacterized protein YdeI (YjbR/CyaY-like superfamily)
MEITQTLYAPTAGEWRDWLKKHYDSAEEIWLVFYRKEAGKPNIAYAEAVEEALCFGWIDSIRKTLDRERYAHRFTPRKPRSGFSQTNIERLRVLLDQGKVMPEIRASAEKIVSEPFNFPEDIMAILQADREIWENFQGYSAAYQRIRIAFIDSARKRPQEYEKRLRHFLKMTAQDKQYGYGIEKFY